MPLRFPLPLQALLLAVARTRRHAGITVLLLLAPVLFWSGHAQAKAGGDEVRPHRAPTIRVAEGDWGSATRDEVELVLASAAEALQDFFPGRDGMGIRVERAERAPMVLYRRGAEGEYVVLLTARGRGWAEYAYEFGHELCHVYANYDRRPNTALAPHQWFEESLCEAASLFVLRRMARRWASQPPLEAWRGYAPVLSDYAQLLANEPHRLGETPLGPWYAEHAASLSGNPYGRRRNEYCANRVLHLFESHPDGWSALQYLNAPTEAQEMSFANYLLHWHQAAPREQKPFLARLLRLFDVLPEASAAQ